MPVSRPKMMTSDRTTSTTTSNTGDERLLAQDVGQRGMLVGQQRPNRVQLAGAAGDAKLLGERADNAPIRSSMRRWRRAALLALDATLQVGDRSLALVGVRHRQEHIDARVLVQLLRGGQDQPRKRTGVQLRPLLVADGQQGLG